MAGRRTLPTTGALIMFTAVMLMDIIAIITVIREPATRLLVASPYSWGVSEVKGLVEIVPHLSPYIDICYSYNIIKKISITTSINYSFIYYGSTGGIGDCNYIWQSLLSVNVGLKYNIINKVPKAK